MRRAMFVFRWGWGWVVVGVTCALAGRAGAQGPPDYDFQWRTVGAAGNRATNLSEVVNNPTLRLGAVPYEYRLTATEVTVSQWYEFVVAYARVAPGGGSSAEEFTSPWIVPDGAGGYVYDPATAQWPANVGWRYGARLCNWLSNNKGTTLSAFETGAYDVATFTQNPDGSFNDQLAHSPGAMFWLPTRDEWTKGGYYDPNRYGQGQGGYWRYPISSGQPPIGGLPGTGAQTSADPGISSSLYPELPVGSYPAAQSPWGLLDVSGGAREWTEEAMSGSEYRITRGSRIRSIAGGEDLIDGNSLPGSATFGLAGIRLASSVPAPGTATALLVVAACVVRHPRRRC